MKRISKMSLEAKLLGKWLKIALRPWKVLEFYCFLLDFILKMEPKISIKASNIPVVDKMLPSRYYIVETIALLAGT